MQFNKKFRIVCSFTRAVVLCGPCAVKIMRPRPLKGAMRIVIFLFRRLGLYVEEDYAEPEEFQTMTTTAIYEHRILSVLADMVGGPGVASNFREWLRWKNRHVDDRPDYTPTLFTFFWLVNIQTRTEQKRPLPNKIFCQAHGEREAGKYDDYPDNKGVLNGKDVWTDYGFPTAPPRLQ